MRTSLVFVSLLGFLCVMPALSGGDPSADEPPSEQARLRGELRRLEQTHGSSHPNVLALKARLGEQPEPVFKGPVLVLTRVQSSAVTLRDIRGVAFAGRHFVVGTENAVELHHGNVCRQTSLDPQRRSDPDGRARRRKAGTKIARVRDFAGKPIRSSAVCIVEVRR